MNAEELAAIEALAALARAETFRPGWPYQGSGEWTENVIGMLGGATGDFAGAMSPDVADAFIAAVRERDNTIARVRDIVESVHMSDDLDPDGYQVAGLIRAALDPQETP